MNDLDYLVIWHAVSVAMLLRLRVTALKVKDYRIPIMYLQ